MTSDWMPIIGVSVAIMALMQVATMIGLIVALRRIQTGVQAMERKVDGVIAELRPQLIRVVEDARAASVSAQELLTDLRRHLEAMEDAADSVRQRVTRVVDGVQSAASHLSRLSHLASPMKTSGPAAMAVWAGMRMMKTVADRVRERRRERHMRDRQLREAESYVGIG